MYAFFKRLFDILISLMALPFVLLVIIIFAPFIFLTDRGPVFYNAPRVGKNGKIKLCAAENEEEDEERRGPTVKSVHKLFREITDIAEDSAEHHAAEKRGERDVNSTN